MRLYRLAMVERRSYGGDSRPGNAPISTIITEKTEITEKFFRANEQKNEQYSRVNLKIENGPKRRILNNTKKGGIYAAFLFFENMFT